MAFIDPLMAIQRLVFLFPTFSFFLQLFALMTKDGTLDRSLDLFCPPLTSHPPPPTPHDFSHQVGLGFRNEISPRAGLLRVREFCMAEVRDKERKLSCNTPI